MKKKIVLIGIYLPGIYPPGKDDCVTELLAPAYLKAFIKADKDLDVQYEIEILNLPNTISHDDIIQIILKQEPYLVGFSVYIWNFQNCHEITRLLNHENTDIPIIWGGPEVSFTAIDILDANPGVDIVVCGSGEEKFKRILQTNLSFEQLCLIPSIALRDQSGNPFQVDGQLPTDINTIPSPFQTGVIDLNDGRERSVYIETYRGCIFTCGYCMWMGDREKGIDLFPLEQVFKDIDVIYNSPNVKAVIFTDACIFYRKKRAKEIIDRIAKCKYKPPTTLTLDIAFLDEEGIEALTNLTFSQHGFHFGMQSINQDTLKIINRKVGPKLIKKRIDMLHQLVSDVNLSFDLIYGLPGDNHNTFRNTLDFALNLSPAKLNLSPLVLLPGSPYWKKRKELGFVYNKQPPYFTQENYTYSREDMKKTQYLVLGVIMVMYYARIRTTIYNLSDAIGVQKRLELFDTFVQHFDKQTHIFKQTLEKNGDSQNSFNEVNNIRREIMDQVSLYENGIIAYQTIYDIVESHNQLEAFGENLQTSINIYKALAESGETAKAQCIQLYGKDFVEQTLFKWVVSKSDT